MMQQPLELRFGRPSNGNGRMSGSSRCLELAEQWAAEEGGHHTACATLEVYTSKALETRCQR